MSSTTQKHRNFVSEPMGDKPVTALPGIGPVLGVRLAEKGYSKASAVYGDYLVKGQQEQPFKSSLTNKCNANSKQAGDCFKSLKSYSDNHL